MTIWRLERREGRGTGKRKSKKICMLPRLLMTSSTMLLPPRTREFEFSPYMLVIVNSKNTHESMGADEIKNRVGNILWIDSIKIC